MQSALCLMSKSRTSRPDGLQAMPMLSPSIQLSMRMSWSVVANSDHLNPGKGVLSSGVMGNTYQPRQDNSRASANHGWPLIRGRQGSVTGKLVRIGYVPPPRPEIKNMRFKWIVD